MGKHKKTKNETLLMSEAFESYYLMGDRRNIRALAPQVGRAVRTVQYWSDAFRWQERVLERDREIAARIAQKNIKDVADTKDNYRKMIKLVVSRFVAALTATDAEGKPLLKVENIADVERMIKLDLTLMGEVTEISKVQQETTNVNTGLSEADREAVKELAAAILKDIQSAGELEDEVTIPANVDAVH